MSSEKQINANRKNSLKSTGPKHIENTKFNATKHGICAKTIVIEDGLFAESSTEFKRILSMFNDDIQPQGILEGMLVEEMACCYWKMRRITLAENSFLKSKAQRNVREIAEKYQKGNLFDRELETMGIESIERLKQRTKERATALQSIDSPELNWFLERQEYAGLSKEDALEKAKDEAGRMIEFYSIIIEKKNEQMIEEGMETVPKANIPDDYELELLTRYSTAVKRDFYRALNQLMQLRGKTALTVQIN
ncbi:hypothetical protein KJ708_06920 [bacterium]|nr:hypothetical protein [bacterium]